MEYHRNADGVAKLRAESISAAPLYFAVVLSQKAAEAPGPSNAPRCLMASVSWMLPHSPPISANSCLMSTPPRVPEDSHLCFGWVSPKASSQGKQAKGRGEQLQVGDQVLQHAAEVVCKGSQTQLPRDSQAKIPQKRV